MSLVWCCEISYPFDKSGVLTHNPFKLPHMINWATAHPIALEPSIALALPAKSEFAVDMILHEIAASEWDYKSWDISLFSKQVSTLYPSVAIAAIWLEDYSVWRTHIVGMEHILNMNGDQQSTSLNTLNKIRFADIEGAIITKDTPSLPFARQRSPLLAILPNEISQSITSSLQPPASSL
ncbi:uncharacterized protein BCR38DRAFT_488034 [Pseudomassariella vexata]|uniref:Uncharacterized protein n=1 Tax=Pseudomassariella vexata TaxID=1141098 RepID=A0A1Y2DQR1_9PEZI|nr:uncharacterized protein BCR38DRAFT_488034 [Pseudomassariella vexata]ORY60975.1 hypothetical protein BCR38DRAFT_488034 [Pseudomassariella vexata]